MNYDESHKMSQNFYIIPEKEVKQELFKGSHICEEFEEDNKKIRENEQTIQDTLIEIIHEVVEAPTEAKDHSVPE